MAVTIRNAELRRDVDEILQFLCENLGAKSTRTRFEWLYLQNPFGPARAWMAVDGTHRTVGVAAAFPRSIWIDCKPRRAWVLGDFCIAAGSRSLGPAVLLQRTCLEALASDENPVWYDFPSQSMLAVYRRLGIAAVCNHVRYVKVIRMDEKVHNYISCKPLADGISAVGNVILRLGRSSRRGACNETSLYDGVFREEFTSLDARTACLHPIRGRRSAEYLNWRYLQDPFHQYRVAVARRGAELLGYAVLRIDGKDWILADLHAVEEATTVPRILAFLDSLAQTSDVSRIIAPIIEGSPLSSHLRRAGFYPREGVPVVACFGDSQSALQDLAPKSWFLMYGDRES
jgi:hypothetical protein